MVRWWAKKETIMRRRELITRAKGTQVPRAAGSIAGLLAFFVVFNSFISPVSGRDTSGSPGIVPPLTPTSIDGTAGWRTYTNNIYGYSLLYPPDWQALEVIAGPEAYRRVDFIPTATADISEIRPMVSVTVIENTANLTAEQWAENELSNLPQEIARSVQRQSWTLSGKQALRVTGLPSRWGTLDIIVGHGSYVYWLMLIPYNPSEAIIGEVGSQTMPIFTQMVSTFRFTE